MGSDQEIGGIGTVNDLRNDLGLSLNELTWRIEGSVRPLEHHVIRAYGTIPERYIGTNVLNRELRTRTSTYPAGSRVDSRFEIAAYGMGYDLDLLVGPSFFGGFHGDLIYMSSKVSFGTAPLRDADDVIAVHELVPCLGAHGELTSVFPFSRLTWGPKIGAFGRLTYAMTPNYLNYVDIKLGLSLRMQLAFGPILEARSAFEHESLFHDQEPISGKLLEYSRDGISFSLGAAF
jgi:hypothetical protein